MSTHFWSYVRQRATSFHQRSFLALVLIYRTQPEIGELQLPEAVQQQIFRFQVTVTDTDVVDEDLYRRPHEMANSSEE